MNQGAIISYPASRLIIPVGHNLNGLVCSLRCSSDNFATDDHEAAGWTQGDALFINKQTFDFITELITNGGFNSNTNGWTGGDGTIASIAGGQVGNCLELTRTGGGYQVAYQPRTLIAGQKYKVSFWVKSGTSGNEAFGFYSNDHGTGIVGGTSSASWVHYEGIWTATAQDAADTNFYLAKGSATAGTMLFDEISVKKYIPSPIIKRYWKLNIAAPASPPELSEMFLSSDYVFEENVGINLADGEKRNVAREESSSGLVQNLYRGDPRRSRRYQLLCVSATQKANLKLVETHCLGIKPFYILDHAGDLIYVELLNELEFTHVGADLWACSLELLEWLA